MCRIALKHSNGICIAGNLLLEAEQSISPHTFPSGTAIWIGSAVQNYLKISVSIDIVISVAELLYNTVFLMYSVHQLPITPV